MLNLKSPTTLIYIRLASLFTRQSQMKTKEKSMNIAVALVMTIRLILIFSSLPPVFAERTAQSTSEVYTVSIGQRKK